MIKLTNKNVRARYIEEKARAKVRGDRFTYADMAAMFETDDRTIYTWVAKAPELQHLPSNEAKRSRLVAWINDGVLNERKTK